MNPIFYKEGYKYQIVQNHTLMIDLMPEEDIKTPYIILLKTGGMTISNGYAWDGPSGPTVDTPNFMRGSLVHDALYQLMREGFLDNKKYRKRADEIMRTICREDGMSITRAWIAYRGVRMFGDPSADPANKKKVTQAPE